MSNRLLVPRNRKTPGLLDLVPGAAAAYSLRSLSNSYADPVVTVRRSSDNAEDSFTASEVADGTLAAFCGAGDGFVYRWWDQSGNARHAVAAADTNEPKIVDSGVVVTEEGKPALQFDGSNDYLDATAVVVSQPDTVFAVLNRVSGAGNHLIDGITTRQVLSVNASLQDNIFAGTSLPGSTPSVFGELVLYCIVFNGASSSVHRDGVQVISGNAGGNALNGLRIGAFTPTVANLNGTISELIIYPSDLTEQRELVEGLIAWGYSV